MHNVYNPYTCEVFGAFELSTDVEVEAMLSRGHRLSRGYGLAVDMRKAILLQVAEVLEGDRERFTRLIACEGGKPRKDAATEVERAIDGLRLAAEGVDACLARAQVEMERTAAARGHSAYTMREPIGLVVAISAFNHPLNLIVHQVAPAVATGCPIIVKPSLSTPYSCMELVKLLHGAGVPEDALQVALCDDRQAERLATDGRVAYVSFIGSAKVGWGLRSKIAPGTRIGLEHGGIAPVILGRGADMEQMVMPVIKGGFYHAGQVCVSTQRVFVPNDRLGDVTDRLVEATRALVVGDPQDVRSDVGPLIRPREVTRVGMAIREAVDAGAVLACGGEALGKSCFAPTLLVNPPEHVSVSQEELFGPAIMLYGYDRMEEAVERANHPRWAFQAAVFSADRAEIAMAVQGLDCSGVMVNEMTAFRTDWMPFGGRKASGLGVGGIGYTLEEYTQYKLVVERILG